MSKITSPILLDATGQEINNTLKEIRDALRAQGNSTALIDDENVSASTTWSSNKITNALTVSKTESGSVLVFDPISTTAIVLESTIEEAATVILTHSTAATTITRTIDLPAAGTFNWGTGVFTGTDGSTQTLTSYSIKALEGTNTLSVDRGTLTATYRAIGSSEPASWDVIYGGSSAEEV